MKNIYLNDVLDLCKTNLICGENTILEEFTTNSKEVKENDIFIGIKGETNDGSKYYLDAFEHNASGCILNKGFAKKEIKGKPI